LNKLSKSPQPEATGAAAGAAAGVTAGALKPPSKSSMLDVGAGAADEAEE
jgi:hypothetical protein